MTKIITIGLLATSLSHAATTLFGVNVEGFNDESGNALGAGVLALVVVDTGNDGFGAIQTGDFQIGATLGDDDFIGDGNDLVVKILDSTSLPSVAIQGDFSINLTNSLPTAGVGTAGDQFAIYWFSTLSVAGGDNGATAGDRYGVARETDWVLGANGTNPSVTNVTSAGNATFTVVAVPEPTSSALLGLGALGLLMRRRR